MLVPQYMPKGYAFKSLTVQTMDTGAVLFDYCYSNINDMIEIEIYANSDSLGALRVNEVDRKWALDTGDVYIQETDKKIAIMQRDDGNIITVWCRISDAEISKLLNELER